jgi:hypothetical protein
MDLSTTNESKSPSPSPSQQPDPPIDNTAEGLEAAAGQAISPLLPARPDSTIAAEASTTPSPEEPVTTAVDFADEEQIADSEPQEPPMNDESMEKGRQQESEEEEDELMLASPARPSSRSVKKSVVGPEEANVETPRRRSTRSRTAEPERLATPATIRRTRSVKPDDAPPYQTGSIDTEPSAYSVRRATRASNATAPSPAPSTSTSKNKRSRKSVGDEVEGTPSAPSPGKRSRRVDAATTPKPHHSSRRSVSVESGADEPFDAPPNASTSATQRVHHHHHQYASTPGKSLSTPTTRAHCRFVRLRIREKVFSVPSVSFLLSPLFLPI